MTRTLIPASSLVSALQAITLSTLFCLRLHATGTCRVSPGMAVKMRSPNIAAYQELGAWFERSRQLRCAVDAYQQGTRRFPGSATLQLSLGSALQASGVSGEEALRRAVSLDPSSQPAHLALGVLEHDRGNRSEALRQWQEVLRLNPSSATALDWIAKTRIESQQYTAAVDLLLTAPDTEDLAIDRIVALSRSGFSERAIEMGAQSLKRHRDWLRLRMALGTVLLQRNRFEEALALLQEGLRDHPGELDLQVLYLRALVLSGDSAKSKSYAGEFLKIHPNSFDGLYLNGLLERQAGEYEQALVHLKAAAALQPHHFDVLFNLGATLAKLHQPEEASAELTKAAVIDGSGPEVHFQLAGVLRALNHPEDAKKEMDLYKEKLAKRALRDQQISLSAQAAQKLASGDAAGAIEAENQILKISPDDAVHYYNLSLAQDLTGDLDRERASLEHAVALRRDFAPAYNQLGYLAIKSGDTAAAEGYFRKAIASAPEYAEAESNLGSLLAREGKDSEAEGYFRLAIAANPRYTDAWINLAASLAARSKFTDARNAIQSALQIEPDNPDAAQLLAMLPQADTINLH